MKVKVKDGWQLAHDDGTVAGPGETVEVDNATGEQWIAAGMASKVVAKKKAVASSKNKAVTTSANKTETKETDK